MIFEGNRQCSVEGLGCSQVFHCVMYPYVTYDLPILSMDVVAKDGKFSLGIIDPCPVALDRSLPVVYDQMCRSAPSYSSCYCPVILTSI